MRKRKDKADDASISHNGDAPTVPRSSNPRAGSDLDRVRSSSTRPPRAPTELEVAGSLEASNVEILPDFEHKPSDFAHSDDSSDAASTAEKDRSSVEKDAAFHDSTATTSSTSIAAEDHGSNEKEVGFRDSTATSSTVSTVSKYNNYDPSQLHELPPQRGHPLYRAFRWQFFSVYRKIYTVVFSLNLIWGLVGFSVGDFGESIYASGRLVSDRVADAVAVNIMVAIAIRNEHVINVLFSTAIAAPHWLPLWFRRACAMIYSYGGFHSGCATASAAWYAVYTGVAVKEYVSGRQGSPVFVVFASLILALLVGIIVLAMPNLRARFHNHFEGVHRFAGWTVLGLFWGQLIASAILGGRMTGKDAGIVLITSPAFWFLTVATLCVIYPWARLRQRDVEVEVLSTHAVRIHLDYGRPALCSAIRLSDRPLVENHAFATIPRADGAPGFSCVVSSAGDWTRRIIAAPPRRLYVRSGPNQGMAAVTRLFAPVVMVATGSGIGPCLGFFVGRPRHDVHIIWSTKNPERTYGKDVIDAVLNADPNARIIDTDKTGRPDIVRLAYSVYKDTGAEAISIISNKKVVDMVVYEMESRGVPAYGPIWDS
ncbi:hypothetical protein SLS56_005858 [Neofusicoccum ribis]|uniref:Integral membrane protein TmpA n=1 Tax=Neofusicoccum ribis TaxID=45134 RepID=A0ABR3SSB4_9PEZI